MDRLLAEKEILDRIVPWGRTTLWRKVRQGKFPAPRAVSENRKAWLESEISDWISGRPVAPQYTECGYQPGSADSSTAA